MLLFEGEIIDFKSLKIIAEFYGHGENNWFDLFMYTNKQYSSLFKSYTQAYKECQAKTNVKQLIKSTPVYGLNNMILDYGHS